MKNLLLDDFVKVVDEKKGKKKRMIIVWINQCIVFWLIELLDFVIDIEVLREEMCMQLFYVDFL